MEQLKVALELGSTESVITAVSEGRGISIISSIAAKKAHAAGLVKIVKIKEAKNPRKLYIVRPKRPLVKILRLSGNSAKTINSKIRSYQHRSICRLKLNFD